MRRGDIRARPRRSGWGAMVCAVLVAGCVDLPTEAPAPPPQAGPRHVVVAPASGPAFGNLDNLPAWETAAERAMRGKLDANDDYRKAHKEWYAQTRPPAKGQFRPFSEWEPMAEVWTTYTDGMMSDAPVRRMFAEQTIAFIRHGKPPVKANVIVGSTAAKNDFLKALDSNGITASEKAWVVMVTLPHNTIWHIDYSGFPIIEKKTGRVAFADWVYYPARTLDDAVPTRLANGFYNATVYRVPIEFEGGNIQTDGVNTCATTNRSLENTGFSALKVGNLLSRYVGCTKTLVVKDITDDGTGHIDMFFKWIAVDEVMIGRYENTLTLDYNGDGKTEVLPLPGSVAADYAQTFALNRQRMDDNAALFSCLKSAKGTPFKVHRLPMMTRFKDSYGDLPRTFINSTFSNKVNVYPSYSEKSCRNAGGALCMKDADCAVGQHCAAARCTQGPVAQGCDELLSCPSGLQCAVDPMKVALRDLAQKQWQAAMPDWKHVGLRADTITLWSGAIHCITRNIPLGKVEKIIPDGNCSGGVCSGPGGGTVQACSASTQCTGPKWDCDCNICQGKCAGGQACSDDADCSLDGKTVVDGACVFDAAQACYTGQVASNSCAGRCGKYQDKATCQCDDQCTKYKDCCGDYVALCTGSSGGSPLTQCDDDAGSTDAGSTDAGGADAGSTDIGCQPSCANKNCGPDGCGGVCGLCPAGWTCGFKQTCTVGMVDAGSPDIGPPDAGSVDVGPQDTGSVDAGSADAGSADAGTTEAGCQPQCQGRVCGPNGCGGICGQCLGGGVCTPAGTCQAASADAVGTEVASAADAGAAAADALVAGDVPAQPYYPAGYGAGSGGSSCSAARTHRSGRALSLLLSLALLGLMWRRATPRSDAV